jgi:biopolymer transport protein ExbD
MASSPSPVRRGRRRDLDGIHEINLTPLIDVSLVLVVILMVAMPMAFQSSIAVRGAAASGRRAAEAARAERVEVTILGDDQVLVNREQVAREDLAARLAQLLAVSATRQVVVRCADGVTHGSFVSVLDEAKSCGAAEIAVVAPWQGAGIGR